MSAPAVDVAELPPEIRRRLGVRAPKRGRSMTMDQVRSLSIRVLAVLADLTAAERARVLRHALKVNEV